MQQSPDNAEYDLAAASAFANDSEQEAVISSLGPILLAEFADAEQQRQETELRWLSNLRQYRGQYDPEVEASIGPNRSRAFVRKTRVKVKTINSRVADLLFPAGSEKNWTIEHTPVPSLSDEQKDVVIKLLTQANQGQPPTKEQFDKAAADVAKQAAKKMSKVIEDQLVEARYKKASVQAIHSAHLYGTGIIKGPLVEKKVRTQFAYKDGQWEPLSETYITPFVDYVPLWRFYPDMSATTIDECRYVYERHLMTKSAMASLSQRKTFSTQKIRDYILSNPDGETNSLYLDSELKSIGERTASQGVRNGQYEVLERWGWLDGQQLVQAGVDIPPDRLHESFFSNVWMLPNGDVIKAVLQPINGVTWPYHLYYFDKDETNIFAEGLGSVMKDDQTMINAATRMALDNAAITSGAMIEVSPSLLSNMEKMDEMHPWKIWFRNGTLPGNPAIRPITLPSNLKELFDLVQLFEGNSDEVTAIPRYMTGENSTQGAAGTASGMSMLMAAANIVIKDLITSWDEGVTRPFLQSLYRWNMQFHHDNTIKGDFDVKARGTASLVAKEIRSQQLNNFAQMTANELDAPYVKRDKLLQQRAEANELSDCVKTEEEVQAEQSSPQAQQAQQAQQMMQQAQMAQAKAQVEKLIADAQRMMAQVEQIKAQTEKLAAETVAVKVGAEYAAMQAGGVATERPEIAPAGDVILKQAGWVSQQKRDAMLQAQQTAAMQQQAAQQMAQQQQPQGQQGPQGQPVPPIQQPQTGMQGEQSGIETARIE